MIVELIAVAGRKNILNESRTGGGREFDSFLCPFKYKSQRLCILLTRGESLTTWWWILIFKRPRQQHSTRGNHSSSSSGGVIYYVLDGLKRRPSYVEKYPQLYYWYMQLINAYLMCHRGGGGTTCVCWGTRISYLLSPYDCDPVHVSVGKQWHYTLTTFKGVQIKFTCILFIYQCATHRTPSATAASAPTIDSLPPRLLISLYNIIIYTKCLYR